MVNNPTKKTKQNHKKNLIQKKGRKKKEWGQRRDMKNRKQISRW